ncbi:DUF4303 domain-containing protein [Dyella mobilis]|uniref:DUF4303 domain-containing protein n=1 Tax=Dyella mobilis TaxID=1849582 RepID=A0ABS2KL16_9GAMM|nr:DUF4303 domain-containing protein [Dyella mobilis]MBM7131856.1 DUF4303 domain-containing protein [Dyella mobilis]GLQ96164.1 hypothetical protein GCM10007863_05820 [Dyella mobilis]
MGEVTNLPRNPLDRQAFEAFKSTAETVAMQMATRVLSEYGEEGIYAFAFCLNENYKRVSATVMTEVALNSLVEERWAKPRLKRIWQSPEALAVWLRWKYSDLPSHKALAKSPELEVLQKSLSRLWKTANIETSEDYNEVALHLRAALMEALDRVRKQGVLRRCVAFNVFSKSHDLEFSLRISEIINFGDAHRYYRSTVMTAVDARRRAYTAMLADFRTKFEQVALRAARLAVEQYGDEDIYGFAIITDGDWKYVFPAVLTEAGLSEVAKGYGEMQFGDEPVDVSDIDFRTQLRWSAFDSPRHEALADVEGIEEVDKLVRKYWGSADTGSEAAYVDARDAFVDAVLHVLASVRDQGIFRNPVVMNFFTGDQGEQEKFEYSERVNSTDLHEWFCTSSKEGLRIYFEWSDRLTSGKRSKRRAVPGLSSERAGDAEEE